MLFNTMIHVEPYLFLHGLNIYNRLIVNHLKLALSAYDLGNCSNLKHTGVAWLSKVRAFEAFG